MKTSKLSGAALDWAVAKCEPEMLGIYYTDDNEPLFLEEAPDYHQEWAPSTNWAQGGPIIEREKIGLHYGDGTWGVNAGRWEANHPECLYVEGGDTPLIAAMRCYVASKMGDSVQLPEELK